MTQRERLASAGATMLASRPASPSAVALRPPSRSWEEVFNSAAPALQDQLRALARRQRLPCAQQLPKTHNGHAAPQHGDAQHLLELLSGQTATLRPVTPGPLEFCDTSLDESQREAVGRALATPDIFLLQGLPGTGKSRVVAEIVMQAALRGERVLLLAPGSAPIDRVLEWVGEREAICPIRCLGADERLESLPPSSRSLTFGERLRQLGEQPLVAARQEVTVLEQRCQRRRQDDIVLARLQSLAERARELEEAQRARRARIAAEVTRQADAVETDVADAGAFAANMATASAQHHQCLGHHDSGLRDLRIRADERRRDQAGLQPHLDSLRGMLENREHGRWWTPAWWRALFHGKVAAEFAALETTARQIRDDVQTLEGEITATEAKRKQAEAAYQKARARRIDAETTARQQQLDDQARILVDQTKTLEQEWKVACAEVDAAARPEAMTAAAAEKVRAAAHRLLQADDEQLAFARQWLQCLEESSATLPERLTRHANLVAATTLALPADERFAAAHFDLLILQDADQVTKSEFLGLARRAQHWVLVSEAQGDDACHTNNGNTAAATRLSTSLRPGFFHDLWHGLHCDPRTRACTWVQEKYRLCCKLRPIAPEQRQWLECERVADAPDIELRILTLPRAQPVLAEVVFPASMSIAQAKTYLFREMQELPVCATAAGLRWSSEADKLVLHLGPAAADATRVCLEPGVHEVIGSHPVGSNGDQSHHWTTTRIEFEGWQRVRAQEWLERHLGLRDLSRTARLDVPHRMHPELAAFVSELLYAGAYRVGDAPANGAAAHIEFVSVGLPRSKTAESRGRGHNGKHSSPRPTNGATLPKAGAGLELDLTDRRHRDRLPTELRPGLPDHGFVNYFEAQAVVRYLEGLVADPGQAPPAPSDLAVMALYPAQAALINRLMKQSAILSAHSFMPVVDVPAAFRQREFAVVLLSLTRSHLHRAVSFGDGPAQLALALTRACSKLVLFGDPGTLARRCQWTGAVDHLDEATANRERNILAQLLRYLEGQGPHQRAFLLRAGSAS